MKFWTRKKKETHYAEEDPYAFKQNQDEIKFNKFNKPLRERSENAKKSYIKRMSRDTKYDILEKINIDDALDEAFEFGDREELK